MKRPLTAILAGVALLLGGCNLSGESSTGQGTVNLSVGISKPTAGAHTNQRDVEVRIAATGGRVESAKLAYAGPSSGEIPLTPSGGVWRGTLPESLSSGTYTLKAEARVGSFIKESGPIVFVFDKDKPQITILAPTSPVTLSSASLEVRVRVQDAHSGLKSVKLFAENTLLEEKPGGSGEEYAFKVNRDTLPEGAVALRVVAEDLAGNTQEATVPVEVDRTPPTVVWKAPADGAVVSGTVTLEVEATDNVGVAKVEFFAGSTKLGEATSAPFTFNWNTTAYPDGPVTLKARAVDAAGNAAEATLTVTVANQDKTPPTVVWKAPADGAVVSGTVTLEVEATDNVGVAKVEFFAGSTKLGEATSAPFTFNWNTTAYPDGPVTLKARAVDAAGNAAEATLTVTVANQDKTPPTVVWKAPADGAVVSGTVTLEVEATDNVGVAKVEFFAGSTKLGEATSAPFTFNWNTTAYPDGPVTLKARAVDAAGNAAEATLTVTVANQDKTPPTVVWKAPADGAVVSGTVTLEVEATDNVGVAKVEFFAGSTKLGEATSAPFTFNWNTTAYPDGPVTLKARAVDAAGNAAEATLTVTVANQDKTPPTVVWKAPADGAVVSGTVTLEVEATDNVGVAKVEFFAGSTKLGEATSAPFTFNWNTTAYPDGPVTLKARAVDAAGNAAEATLTVTVANQDKTPPTVVWKAPADGAVVSGTVTLEVEATDNVGVAKVEFFAGSTKLGEATSAPFTFNWNTTAYPDGPVTLKARAVDAAGNAAEATLTVTVANQDKTPPTVVWKAPADGAVVSGTVTLEVEATDNVGVAKVEFFAGSTKLGEATSAPFTFNWNTTAYPDGPVTLKARAVDAAGNAAEATLTVTVANQDKTPPTVVWKAPADGAVVSGTVTLEVEATDNVGVAKVEFFAGSTKLGEATSAPFTFNWNTTAYPDGPVTLKARAVDAAGNAAEATLTVTVANQPKVFWLNPTPNQKVAGSVDLQVEVQALRPIDRVEFYFGPDENSMSKVPGTPTPSGNTYTLSWDVLQVQPGNYLLKVVVVDVQGSQAQATIPVEVGSAFVITTPAEGDKVGPGANRSIVAITVGINGTLPPGVSVTRVAIYINGEYQGDATSDTAGDGSQIYIYTWNTAQSSPGHDPTLSGDRVITARVYYTGGDTWTNGVRVSYQP
ncbi:Ig-like domain-containing protein [Thermus thermophilus]|uniref:Ig-like domain-containing protein n=1 Tax=Thermus thermophilus TaxID=274 RepID=UPI00333EB66A